MNRRRTLAACVCQLIAVGLCVGCVRTMEGKPSIGRLAARRVLLPLDKPVSANSASSAATNASASHTTTPQSTTPQSTTPQSTTPQSTASQMVSTGPQVPMPLQGIVPTQDSVPSQYIEPSQSSITSSLASVEAPVLFDLPEYARSSPSVDAVPVSYDPTAAVATVAAMSMPTNQTPATQTPAVQNAGATMPAASDQAQPPPLVQITIHNVQPRRGPVRVAAFTNAANFPSAATKGLTAVLAPEATSVNVSLPMSAAALAQAAQSGKGSVAVAVYQDINGDGQLNRGRNGIPTEPCAFSRAAMGRRGPPTFEQAAVPLDLSSSTSLANVEITLPGADSAAGGRP